MRAGGRGRESVRGVLSPKPPYNDEEPEDDDEEDNVPEPAAALPRGHVIHAAEGARQNARRLRERVVLKQSPALTSGTEGKRE